VSLIQREFVSLENSVQSWLFARAKKRPAKSSRSEKIHWITLSAETSDRAASDTLFILSLDQL
jgi:hypothetical protein